MATISIERVITSPVAARAPKSWVAWACLFLLWVVIYVPPLFSPPLMDDADADHAEAAREMAVQHDFVTLHIDGVRYLEKAPLIYWLVAADFLAFGVSEFSVRLPIAIAVLLSGWLALVWGRRAFGEAAGFFAAVFVYTSFGFFLFTRVLIPDVVMSLCLAGAFLCMLLALEAGPHSKRYWLALYALLALAVLAKGLAPLVFFSGTAFFYLLITGEWRAWKRFQLLPGILLFLLIAAPWHVLAAIRNQHFLWFYFVNEHFLRFLGKRYPRDYNKLPALLYWSLHLVWLFPWSLFALLVLRRTFSGWREAWRSRRQSLGFRQKTILLCVIWATLVLVFFSLSTNQEYYTFPAYLPLLLLAAGALAGPQSQSAADEHGHSRSILWVSAALCIVGTLAAAVLFAGLWRSRHLPYVSDIGSVLVRRGVGDYTLSMSGFFDLTGDAFAALRLPAALAAVALLCGPFVALALARRRHDYAALGAIAIMSAVFLVAAQIAFGRFSPYGSSYLLAREVKARAGPEDEFALYGDQRLGSSMIFYTQRQVLLVNGRTTTMEFGSRFPDAPKIFLSEDDLRAHWTGPKRVFLFVPEGKKSEVDAVLGAAEYTIAQSSGKYLLSNRPE